VALDTRERGPSIPDLLANELADPDRFECVEKRIKRGRSKLNSV